MLRRFLFPCALAVLALTLVAAPNAMAVCASASATPAEVAKRTVVRSTLCTLNAERARHGLPRLRLNKKLSAAARRHAGDHLDVDGQPRPPREHPQLLVPRGGDRVRLGRAWGERAGRDVHDRLR